MYNVLESIESINARLEASKEAQKRSRITIITIAIITSMMIIVYFNAYLSYDRDWLNEAKVVLNNSTNPSANAGEYFRNTVRTWNDSRYINISLLGIRVSVDDTLFLGNCALMLTCFWLLLSCKRENHTIGFLLRDTDNYEEINHIKLNNGDQSSQPKMVQWFVFHSIISNTLITDISTSFAPIRSITGGNPSPVQTNGKGERFWFYLFKFFSKLFYYYPLLTSTLIIILEKNSFTKMDDPFEIFYKLSAGRSDIRLAWNISVNICITIILFLILYTAERYSSSTAHILKEYYDKIKRDSSAKQTTLT